MSKGTRFLSFIHSAFEIVYIKVNLGISGVCWHDLNFLFNFPLQPVTVTVDPGSTCLSMDSGFNLTAGVGIFPGSICEPNVQNIRLTFTVTSTISMADISTSSFPLFNVTGER